MVLLSLALLMRNRGPDRFWKHQELLKHARHFRGRKNRCYSLAIRTVRRAWRYATIGRHLKKKDMRQINYRFVYHAVLRETRTRMGSASRKFDWLWITRITAGAGEHGLKYSQFITSLLKCQVDLNRKVLADLAITEPKTFKCLAALAERRRQEGFHALLNDKEPPGIFSRIAQQK
uniref:Large ribosomal subunit protein bL20m n=1 Tax=Eptatretus burgeri TaxID=7764 RepID=A0A8C4NE62_EPTBU